MCLALPASAHRLNESYVYVDVTDSGMSGEIHIRLTDFQKVLPFDTNADGEVTETEFLALKDEAYAYLNGRIKFITEGVTHIPVMGAYRLFEDGLARQVSIDFTLPDLGPPPDVMETEFTFLFDGPAPAHRNLLLQNSSTRLGLVENEGLHSVAFTRGVERQTFDLRPRPAFAITQDFFGHGVRQVMQSTPHLVLAVLALLAAGLTRVGAVAPVGSGQLIPQSVMAALAFGAGLIGAVWVTYSFDLDFGWKRTLAIFALSALLLVIDAFRPLARVPLVVATAFLGGLIATAYAAEIGLDLGSPGAALGGMFAGIAAAALAIGLVAAPMMSALAGLTGKPRAAHASVAALVFAVGFTLALLPNLEA